MVISFPESKQRDQYIASLNATDPDIQDANSLKFTLMPERIGGLCSLGGAAGAAGTSSVRVTSEGVVMLVEPVDFEGGFIKAAGGLDHSFCIEIKVEDAGGMSNEGSSGGGPSAVKTYERVTMVVTDTQEPPRINPDQKYVIKQIDRFGSLISADLNAGLFRRGYKV